MLRGLYTATTLMEQQTRALDVVANNLANVNTSGYKREYAEFDEFNSVLLAKTAGDWSHLDRGPLNVESEKTTEGYRLKTNSGFFHVEAPGGVSSNREIELRRAEDGTLKTFFRNGYHDVIANAGYKVLGQKGEIKLESDDFSIDKQGNVIANGNVVDRLIFAKDRQIIGTYSGGVKFRRNVTDFSQGSYKITDNDLDIALKGRGFFALETEAGERYSRNGSLELTKDGILVNNNGHALIGENGKIKLEGAQEIAINNFGEVIQNGLIVDKIKIVNPSNIEKMQKQGNNLYQFLGGEEAMKKEDFTGEVVQGVLEMSNVKTVKEMVKMIETQRSYESGQKIIRAFDDTLGKAVNEVGKL